MTTDHIPETEVAVTVNGTEHWRAVTPRRLLSDFLREDLGLTGTHVGCEHGVCGACTILLDGLSVRSCLMFAVQADGSEVTTIEGLLESNGDLGRIQQAFTDHHSLQCGFCTAGFVMSIAGELQKGMGEPEIRDLLSGNLCRCTGYQTILEAAVELARPGAD